MAEWIALDRLLLEARPQRSVGLCDGDMVDHACFRQRVLGWRAAFAAAEGRDWALYFDDAVAFAAALFGAWHAGKRVFLAADNLPATLQALQPQVSGFAGDVPADYRPLAALDAALDDELQALDERACELCVFTSGSTGQPSAIGKRLDQLAREVEALQAAFGAQLEGAQVHGTVSHQHIYGLLFRVLWPLAAGRLIHPRRFFHEDLVGALAGTDTVLVATPAHLKRLPEQLDWASLHGRLRAVFSSGGPLPEDAARQVRQWLGVAPTEVYGSSETGGIAWRRWDTDLPPWQPLPGVQWRIDDGCLAVASAHLETPGWWRTQDRVEALADGRFRLLGRADRIVKIEERRVSLDALERALREDTEVDDVRVLVLPGQREQLAAVVVPADPALLEGGDAARRALGQRLGARLAHAHDAVTRPRRWRLVQALPINAQGKVTQAALAALFQPLMPVPVWDRRDAASATLRMTLDPALRPFQGHFPQAAILPGVAQLDWAMRFGRQAFAMPRVFLRMDAVKFQHVARPGDELTLQLDWDAARNVLAFRYTSSHGVHASGKVVFADAD
ncbi:MULTISPECIES: AMP-binding protein [Stenotrophomonas maltophilia group]|uniref:AMP-binding protein n=1 Tax=Stenotrophomonas maltophilia group TaxID=995085 RepID=UPI0013135ACE|nr:MULTISPECIES: AMP-binding protein [Stenotrophomonas maltophilia group]MCF3496086.1 AMP-binding protein [Stenotrophomonas maltophilia]MDQ4679465.1 AMP-binding protein [Stenotrophomonas maltophilia group sp. RNC7]UGB21621.1 AMP-binding protein [Stenotrophomonas maltophilia]